MTDTLVVAAPGQLTAATRMEFRTAALECLERVVQLGVAALAIDLAATRIVDASGLGTLVMVHKRARERGIATRLLHVSSAVRDLLETTRLEPLFQFPPEAVAG